MKRTFTILALGVGLLAGTALAQSPPPSGGGGGSAPIAQRSIKITAEQGYIIKENIGKGTETSGQAESAKLEIGGKVPNGSALQDFPQLVVEKVPAVRGHKFFVSGGEVVIVDPKDNTIADILK